MNNQAAAACEPITRSRPLDLPEIKWGDEPQEVIVNGRTFIVQPKDTYISPELFKQVVEQNRILREMVGKLTDTNKKLTDRLELMEGTVARMSSYQDRQTAEIADLKDTVSTLKWITVGAGVVAVAATGVGAAALLGGGVAATVTATTVAVAV